MTRHADDRTHIDEQETFLPKGWRRMQRNRIHTVATWVVRVVVVGTFFLNLPLSSSIEPLDVVGVLGRAARTVLALYAAQRVVDMLFRRRDF